MNPTINRELLAASWHSWISNDNRQPAGPWWLQWLWTLLFSAGLAAAFTVLGFAFAHREAGWGSLASWARWFGRNLVVCLAVGGTIHLLFDAGRRWWATPRRLCGWRPWQRTLYFTGTPLFGVLIGWPLGVLLIGIDLGGWIGSRDGGRVLVGTVLLSLLITFVLHHWFAAKSRQIEAEKRATEAQLRLLQAQIEPHFLFNTLANVLSLIDHDTPKAKQMLHAFTEYLRCALVTLRHEQSPLSHELDLAHHYLLLLGARMEDRLRFSITADDAARSLLLPPLLLQPLIENAVQHGLEPTIAGGRVDVRACVAAGRLVIEVQDDGRGLDAPARRSARAGAGMALDNIRQRLLARYGSAATLELQATHPGTLARVSLPLQATS